MKNGSLDLYMKKLSFDEAKKLLSSYKYILLYQISETILEETRAVAETSWRKCKEAYFFDTTGQIHLFEDEETGEMQAVQFIPGDLKYVERRLLLAGKHAKATGKKEALIREYLGTDEDGQTYVVYTTICDLM